MAPKKKPAISDRLSMCARTLHQLGNIPATDMMDVNKYPSLSRFSHALCIIMQKGLWMRTCMIFVIRTKEDPA